MTRSTTTKHDRAHEQKARPFIPAPRRSPEQPPEQTGEADVPAGYPLYPLIRYALDHATALRPRQD
jgi:hypothetical protein